ncbi:MAG TPA: flavodoxin FldA [Candidatus Avimuribaculum pullicola]|nr:flavodoxin FldA [Candidatus Avimuribaculum pullicola]
MKKTVIIYGSSTGTCQSIAETIANKLGVSDILDVAKVTAAQVNVYDNLLLGTSTWGAGDMQDDWYSGIKEIKNANLAGKTVALFGCGDSQSYSDTYCDGMGEIYRELQGTGCNIIGQVPTDGYTYDDSTAVVDGHFVGLALDDVNEGDMTEARIDAWIDSIKDSL